MPREKIPVPDEFKDWYGKLVRLLNENFDHLDGQGSYIVGQLKKLEGRVLDLEEAADQDEVAEHDHSAEDEGTPLDPDTAFTTQLSQAGLGWIPLDGEDGEDGMTVVGPRGPQGERGSAGPPGWDGEDAEEPLWFPGPKGDKGDTGPTGPPGSGSGSGAAMPMPLDPADPDEPMWLPGPQGPKGDTGATGPPGSGSGGGMSMPLSFEPEDPELPFIIPGPAGPAGSAGSPGAPGAPGASGQPGPPGFDGEPPDEPLWFPGPKGDTGPSGLSTGTQFRSVWVLPGEVSLDGATLQQSGTPPEAQESVLLNDAATTGFYFTFVVPRDWNNGPVELMLVYTGNTGGAGTNIQFAVNWAHLVDGDVFSELGTTDTSLLLPGPSASGIQEFSQSIGIGTPNAAGDLIRISVRRNGSAGNDTYTGNARVVAVRLDYSATTVSGVIRNQDYSASESITINTGQFRHWVKRFQLTGSRRLTVAGTGRLSISN